jgi:hypothetical protein
MQTVIRRLIELGRTDLAEVAAKCEAELAAANASIERLRDDVHYAWQTEREVRTKLAAFEDSCRRVVARRKEDGAFIVLTVDLERIESMLATTVAAPAAPAVQAKPEDDHRDYRDDDVCIDDLIGGNS